MDTLKQNNFVFQLLPQVERAVRYTAVAQEYTAEARFNLWRLRLDDTFSFDGDCSRTEYALNAALSLTSADRGNIQLVQDGELVMKAQRGFSNAFLDYFHVVNDGKTACRAAWMRERLVHVPDVSTSHIFSRAVLEVLLTEGIRAVDSVPMIAGGSRMVGVLSVHYRHPRSPRESDLNRFQRLAALVANFIV